MKTNPVTIAGVPFNQLMICIVISTILALYFFLPAITSFGEYLFGNEDIRLFIWLFNHYENAFDNGTNPLVTNDIFYPYGISLSTTSTVIFQTVLYWLLPDSWGVFGKITFLQVLPFIFGGIFSFMLVHRFTKSFLPSLAGSFIFNLSEFHFEKAIHHLNYNMAFAFLPLFFIFYFDLIKNPRDKKSILMLSISLLAIALNEVTVAVMVGFIVFIDIFFRYSKQSNISIVTSKNIIIFSIAALVAVSLYELLSVLSFPPHVTYILIPLIFVFFFLYYFLGYKNLTSAERKYRYFSSMLICALPVFVYLAFLYLAFPTQGFNYDSITNLYLFAVPLENLIHPPNIQPFSTINLFQARPIDVASGVYLGLFVFFLIVLSYLIKGASEEEKYHRKMFLVSLLFSFPVIYIGSSIAFGTPFFSSVLFPLMPILRVPARFIMFALLFLSIMIGLFLKRILESNPFNKKLRTWLVLLIVILILAERIPDLERFQFKQEIPGFYLQLANDPENISIFTYPNFDHVSLENEMYFQTIHKKKLSCGIVSRSPSSSNALFQICTGNHSFVFYGPGLIKPETVVEVIDELDYDYVVVQKQYCVYEGCLYNEFKPIPEKEIVPISNILGIQFGKPIFEDKQILVYSTNLGLQESQDIYSVDVK